MMKRLSITNLNALLFMFVMIFVYGIAEHPKVIYLIQIEVRKEVILDKCSGLLVLLFHNLLLFVEYLLESVLIVGFSSSAICSRHDCASVCINII